MFWYVKYTFHAKEDNCKSVNIDHPFFTQDMLTLGITCFAPNLIPALHQSHGLFHQKAHLVVQIFSPKRMD